MTLKSPLEATIKLSDMDRYKWWVMTGSNRRPSACKADALPAELITHFEVFDQRRDRMSCVLYR